MKTILITMFLSSFMVGCMPKASNEISEMALECMKNQSSITITFVPSHEAKLQKVDNK